MLFVPRQVRLASLPAAAAAAMAKEEAKKEKRSKSKAAAAAAKGPPAPDARVLAAVAAFLESSGFPRTLAALQSEAHLEGDSWKSSPVSLEDAVSKLLESSNSAPGAVTAASNVGQEEVADAVAEEKDAGKKKKSKKGGAEAVEAESRPSELSAPEKTIEKVDDETKEKKRKKKKDSSSAAAGEADAVVDIDEQKPEGKKKKKSKSTSETSDKADAGTAAPTVAEEKSNGANEDSVAVEKGKDVNERKSKKKKKKSGSEENHLVEDKQVAGEDSAPKSHDENKTQMDIEKGEDGKASTDDAVASKKRKLEEDITATEDDVKEPSTISKLNKRQKLSSEPKTLIAFQRVKMDDVKFADERLQDNSYWAKGGADTGYGAKAQEVLGQVRGRGFRHEKTKKKRGSYRGGAIDLQTHSIKFNNSDDE